jgi:hypothetical protein
MFFGKDVRSIISRCADGGVGIAHLGIEHGDERMHERLGQPEMLSVPHRTTHDFPQHVSAPFVRWNHSIADQKRRASHVVGHDAHGRVGGFLRTVSDARQLADAPEQRLEAVSVVVRVDALHDRRHPLEAHAGIDGWRGQRRERSIRAGCSNP